MGLYKLDQPTMAAGSLYELNQPTQPSLADREDFMKSFKGDYFKDNYFKGLYMGKDQKDSSPFAKYERPLEKTVTTNYKELNYKPSNEILYKAAKMPCLN